MDQRQPDAGDAEDARHFDKIRILVLQSSGPDHAGEARDEHDAQSNDDGVVVLLHDGHDNQRDENAGERIDGVHDTHDHLVDNSPDIAADKAQHRTDGGAGQNGGGRHDQREPRADNRPGENIPSEIVCPKQMLQGRRLQPHGSIHFIDVVGRVKQADHREGRDDACQNTPDPKFNLTVLHSALSFSFS